MDFVNYLKQAALGALSRFEIYILGPIWGWLHDRYLSGELMASPMVWVTIFWSLNWLIGSGLALTKPAPLPGQEDERWQPRKSFRSIGKLLVWLVALLMAWGLKKSGITGGFIPAGVLEVGVMVTEFAYLVRNLGRLATYLGNPRQGKILAFAADTMDELAGARTRTHTEVTVSPDHTITVSEEKVTVPDPSTAPTPTLPSPECPAQVPTCPALNEWHEKHPTGGKDAGPLH